jgi:hypothetical protein
LIDDAADADGDIGNERDDGDDRAVATTGEEDDEDGLGGPLRLLSLLGLILVIDGDAPDTDGDDADTGESDTGNRQ